MINSYINTVKTLNSEVAIPFDVNKILTGCTVTHQEGGTAFKLNKPGYYFVSFNGDITGVIGNGGVMLQANGVVVPGAEATNSLTATTDIRNIGFSTIVKVLPSCCSIDNTQVLTFVNVLDNTTFNNANVVITKLC